MNCAPPHLGQANPPPADCCPTSEIGALTLPPCFFGALSWLLTAIALSTSASRRRSSRASSCYAGNTSPVAVTHQRASNFVVEAIADSSDLLVNEIGNYNGTVPMPGGAFVLISADGAWTMTVG